MTRAGQVKSRGERHEKDDRHRLDDRTRYVLGWSNVEKIAALQSEQQQLEKQLAELGGRIADVQAGQYSQRQRQDVLLKLDEYRDFQEIDWRTPAAEVARLEDEKRRLASASDVLRQLTEQLSAVVAQLSDVEDRLDERREARAKTEQKRESAEALREATQALRDDSAEADHQSRFALLDEQRTQALGEHQLSVESCDNRERENIKERIDRINGSLSQIDYNAGRYIKLEARPSPDPEIGDFVHELRSCTEGALTGSDDEQYSEAKFLQVKRVIERFRGRDGQAELDRRWTLKVTDVRNWFLFAASERWREDDKEHEHYSDSGGKSGGQKEKLAYTILAASLAYQFGLEWGVVRSRSFRFVVIDEAFGRGSDESAQYGLRLFAKLNLQLLIVTPLQKIHVIEPFVDAVGFVHNPDGRASMLRNLTIEEYREEKARAAP
jgi:uncharacterized protein YPO0396